MKEKSKRANTLSDICLVSFTFNSSSGIGIGRYADNIFSGVSRVFNPKRIFLYASRRVGVLDDLKGVFYPFILWIESKGQKKFHFLNPEWAAFSKSILGNRKFVVTFHDLMPVLPCPDFVSLPQRMIRPLYAKGLCDAAKNSEHIISVSSQTKEEIIREFGVPAEKISVIPHGVDKKFKPIPTKKKSFTCGYIGGFNKRKSVDYAIKAFSIFKNELGGKGEFHIYGKQVFEYSRLKEFVSSLGMKKSVIFKGAADEAKLPEIYNSFDTFLFASTMEGFGLQLLEAKRCGVPTIVRKDARIPRETRLHSLEVGSEREMAEEILSLYKNAAKRKKLSKLGLEYASKFTWEKTVSETLKIYSDFLS